MKEVQKLGELEHLWVLTLHGNDIEQIPGYRMFVLGLILERNPGLKKLDTVLLTWKERDNVIVYNTRLQPGKRINLHKLKKDNASRLEAIKKTEKKDSLKKEGEKAK